MSFMQDNLLKSTMPALEDSNKDDGDQEVDSMKTYKDQELDDQDQIRTRTMFLGEVSLMVWRPVYAQTNTR